MFQIPLFHKIEKASSFSLKLCFFPHLLFFYRLSPPFKERVDLEMIIPILLELKQDSLNKLRQSYI